MSGDDKMLWRKVKWRHSVERDLDTILDGMGGGQERPLYSCDIQAKAWIKWMSEIFEYEEFR